MDKLEEYAYQYAISRGITPTGGPIFREVAYAYEAGALALAAKLQAPATPPPPAPAATPLLEQLHQLAPLAATATAGPWALCSPAFAEAINTADDKQHIALANIGPGIPHMDNAAFIAAARNLLTPENLALLTAALQAAPSAAPAAAWVAVGDGLPKPTMEGSVAVWELALIARESSAITHVGYYNQYDDEWVSVWGLERMSDVTHWQLLPQSPPSDAN